MESFAFKHQLKQSTASIDHLQTANMRYVMPPASIDNKFLKFFPPAANRYLPGEIISFFSDESDLNHLKQRDASKVREIFAQLSKSLTDYLKAKEAEYEQAIGSFYESILSSKAAFHSKAKQFVERADSTISS
jgi:hypothetical protein